jgi:hypothetical protein
MVSIWNKFKYIIWLSLTIYFAYVWKYYTLETLQIFASSLGYLFFSRNLIIIEHNLDVIANADWIIDLGPEGGEDGGKIVYAGLPKGLLKNKQSHTAKSLEKFLGKKKNVC